MKSLAPGEAAAAIEHGLATGASDAVAEAVSWWESILCCGALGYTCGKGLMDSAHHVIGCRLTQETRVQNALDDMASTVHQSLTCGGSRKEGSPCDLCGVRSLSRGW